MNKHLAHKRIVHKSNECIVAVVQSDIFVNFGDYYLTKNKNEHKIN